MSTSQREKERLLSVMSGYQMIAVIEALERAGATEELMRFVRSDKEVARAMVEVGIASLRNRYAEEEVITTYTYPDGYGVKPIAEQIEIIAELFGLDSEKALIFAENLSRLPEGAEERFAIPDWRSVAATYGEAVEKVLALISERRKLKNWYEGKFGKKYLRQSGKAEQAFAKINWQQHRDILIIPAQFGFLHCGRSSRRANVVFADNEFGLGLFAVGCMLLTHPEREKNCNQLNIVCNGDEYSLNGDNNFTSTPIFYWYDNELCLIADWMGSAKAQSGPASGFLIT